MKQFFTIRSAVVLLSASNLLAASAWAQDAAPVVGEATMVIGTATLSGAGGQSRHVERGSAIRVGDRIETQAGGHVHLRFVDGGRLSVRPGSRLQIENYSHSREQPQMGSIKFRLDEGVVRSITGEWGEAARDRFRLNTPVAAIGVKGTDFVVKSDSDKTAASVYTGAITLTPLANGCMQSVGPCLNGKEKTLSDQMKGQMLEFSRLQAVPSVVPAVDLLARGGFRQPTQAAAVEPIQVARLDKPVVADELRNEPAAVKTITGEARAATVVQVSPVESIVVPPPVQTEQAIVVPPPTVTPPPVTQVPPVTIPAVVEPAAPPEVKQLAWVRSTWTPAIDGDSFTLSFDQAVAKGLERAAGNLAYVLYRPASDPKAVLVSNDSQANFRLAASTAHLVPANGRPAEAVAVDGGSLSVDFSRATFATQLALSSSRIGTEQIAATGKVSSTGVLQTTQSNATINGALSLDGREAGYTFEKLINVGALRGLTLWGR